MTLTFAVISFLLAVCKIKRETEKKPHAYSLFKTNKTYTQAREKNTVQTPTLFVFKTQ